MPQEGSSCDGNDHCGSAVCLPPQWYEVPRDALMMRTQNRPLPQGRVTPRHALAFALVTGVGGVAILYWKVRV